MDRATSAVHQQHVGSGGGRATKVAAPAFRRRGDFLQEDLPPPCSEAGGVAVLPNHLLAARAVSEDHKSLVAKVAEPAVDRDAIKLDQLNHPKWQRECGCRGQCARLFRTEYGTAAAHLCGL